MCSYHLCVERSSPTTLAYILSIFQECDITGGDIKEVNQYYISISYLFQSRNETRLILLKHISKSFTKRFRIGLT
jgi:hypothetical protein